MIDGKIYKKILGVLVLLGMVLAVLAPASAWAEGTSIGDSGDQTGGSVNTGSTCDQGFLTFPTWYRGLTDANCDIVSPSAVGGLSNFIWKIALNILEIMLNVVAYAAVGFVIYGGIKYIISAGSPNGMVSARKTIMNAVIGLIISIVSIAIVNVIAGGF